MLASAMRNPRRMRGLHPRREPLTRLALLGTLSHKGRGNFPNLDISCSISMPYRAYKFDSCARLHIGSEIRTRCEVLIVAADV
jgi:hypothetical protein